MNKIYVRRYYLQAPMSDANLITEFESLQLNNELYILGDLNIISLFKGKYILNKTHETKNHCKVFSPEIKKYNEFCSIYGFKELMNCPTRIT